jgi:hypothetical protein
MPASAAAARSTGACEATAVAALRTARSELGARDGTYSDAWIQTVDDPDFKALVDSQSSMDTRRADKLYLLPPAPQPSRYSINIVRDWAKANGLAVEYVDHLEIQVHVTRQQLARFLEETYGPENESVTAPLQRHVRERLRDDCTYLVVADEF